MQMIELQDVSFRYATSGFQVHIPQLVVAAGEKVAVIGPSGSGKTTLLNLLAGILTPTDGRIVIDGIEITGKNDRQRRDFRIRRIGFVFQDFGLIDYLDVKDNILHPYRITSALALDKDVRNRAVWLAGEMGIADKLTRYPGDISHGERQRVAICRALLAEPKLILADEATGNLDPHNKLHILELLFQAVSDRGATLLAVTHDQELLHHFDRVVNFTTFLQGKPA